jgi:hypothetical protein
MDHSRSIHSEEHDDHEHIYSDEESISGEAGGGKRRRLNVSCVFSYLPIYHPPPHNIYPFPLPFLLRSIPLIRFIAVNCASNERSDSIPRSALVPENVIH